MEIFRRDTDARVAHVRDHRVAVVLFDGQLHLTALGSELDGVGGQVEHDLLVLAAVEPHAPLDACANGHPQILVARERADRLLHFGEHGARIELVDVKLGAS